MYTKQQLCSEFDIPKRRIQFYVEIGLLPRPGGSRRYPVYTDEHVRRLREIQRAKDAVVTLADLRERFDPALDD